MRKFRDTAPHATMCRISYERQNYQQSLEMTRYNLEQADEIVVQIRQALEREEERLRREEARIRNLE